METQTGKFPQAEAEAEALKIQGQPGLRSKTLTQKAKGVCF